MAARDTAGPDGDGFTDLKEYLFGIIPTAPSVGALFTATPATANLAHSFVAKQAAGPGYTGLTRHYAVETTTGEYTAGMAAGLSLAISAVKFHIHKATMHDAGMVP